MAESFVKSSLCLGRQHCTICRDLSEKGIEWRRQLRDQYDVGPTSNFLCPYGVPWAPRPTPRPGATIKQAATFIAAALGGKYAPADVVVQRMETCKQCDLHRVDPRGVEWCGQCGCKVSAVNRELKNLAAYEENLPQWGCKHPERDKGKGWKR